MASAEGARRLYAEATRMSPWGWAGVPAILLLGAYQEGSGPFFWYRVVILVVLAVAIAGELIHRSRWLRRASPEEIRTKAITTLRESVSTASQELVCAFVLAACAVLVPLINWLQDDPVGDGLTSIGMPFVVILMFLHDYFVLGPRKRRLLESLCPENGRESVIAR